MENKLILDGVEYNLSDSLVAKLKEEIAINDAVRHNPGAFDRVDRKQYFFISGSLGIVPRIDVGDAVDDKFYSNANYCRYKELMEQRALHETLNRLLWRYSETHGGDLPFESTENKHYFIYHGLVHDVAAAYSIGMKFQGVVYFKDEETARSAIEEVVKPFLTEHPEFVW